MPEPTTHQPEYRYTPTPREDLDRLTEQLAQLAAALERIATILEKEPRP